MASINILTNEPRYHQLSRRQVEWKVLSKQRQYEETLRDLERDRKFMQYGCSLQNDRIKALSDIRSLIQSFDGKMICLWDPYLTATDILTTLYYSTIANIEMRAIGATNPLNPEACLPVWIQAQQQIFQNGSNNYGVNLEFRCQHGNHGFKFHDRFLIHITNNDTARVWSLGTSVNSLGRQHHIIQIVNNPQHIADAFNLLWSVLDNRSCLVWKSR